ncbi:MAG: PIN domain-containing protein [Caldilineaceae bacterium]
MRYVLDSNIFSGLVRRVKRITKHYDELLHENAEFVICPLVYYEVRRGLEKINATQELAFLERTLLALEWADFTQDDWRVAAMVWAKIAPTGITIADPDLLIGVFAARRGAIVVTHNLRHFQPLTLHLPLTIEDWLINS